jgi:hypothetical protein
MKNPALRAWLGLQPAPASRTAALALGLALLALWLLGRRYAGIVHDATVYAVQGLRRLDPSLGADLFFSHGAQDAYTIFPALYAVLIDQLGTANAALAVTAAGQAAFLAAAAALVWRLVPPSVRWWSLALLAAFSGFYGGVGVFRVAEPFATARTLAEPLVLAALAALVARWHGASVVALALALALHPLVAAPGIAVVYLWHAAARPRLWWLAAFGALLGMAVLAAFPGLRLRLDAEWLAPLVERSPHLFVMHWQGPDWARLLWGALLAQLSLRLLLPETRRLVAAALAVAATGILASFVLVDIAGSALAAGLQLWRAHWLLHLLAILLLPAVVIDCWRTGGAGRAAAGFMAASACFGRAEQAAACALVLVAVALIALEQRRPGWLGMRGQRAALLLALCAASIGLLFEIQARMPLRYGTADPLQWQDYLPALTTVGGLLPLAIALWLLACSRYARCGLVAAALVCVGALTVWDARQPWLRFVDQEGRRSNPFRDAIAPGAQVHWPGPYGRTWLLFGRPEWFSVDQGAGIVFHRATAIAYAERKQAAAGLQAEAQNCAMRPSPDCRIAFRAAQALCERNDRPDYLVLHAPVEGRTGLQWRIPAALGAPLNLYRCDDLSK